MLRITVNGTNKNADSIRLVLEGQLRGDWCGMLERVCLEFLGHGVAVVVDMAGVSYVDDRGVRLVKEHLASRTTITGCNMFVHALIDKNSVDEPQHERQHSRTGRKIA